jgi:hypothetical protein
MALLSPTPPLGAVRERGCSPRRGFARSRRNVPSRPIPRERALRPEQTRGLRISEAHRLRRAHRHLGDGRLATFRQTGVDPDRVVGAPASVTRKGASASGQGLRPGRRRPAPGRRLPDFGPGARLFRAQKRPSRCCNGQTSSEARPGPANAPRSRGETIPPGHLAETRPRARRSQTASRATATHLLGGGELEPTTQTKAADGRLLGDTPKRPPGGPLGRAGAPRSTSDAEPRQGPTCQPPEPSGPGSGRTAVSPSGPMATGSISHREKTHGSIEQRSGGNAESLATDSLAAQSPEVGGAGKTHWRPVATPGKSGRNSSPNGERVRAHGDAGPDRQGGTSFEGSAPSRTADRAAPSSEGAARPARNMANPMAGCRVQ